MIVRAGCCRRTFFISCHKVSIVVHYFLFIAFFEVWHAAPSC
ncbi:unnamed protein product [Acanthoscelides obtectus]|uniref:Uncharacterized protein n=1 Tax=Acanthoscelides obtectus TaxID=200917 RepID=A0A9P0PXL1_ACAOB|nr:unnamed protein product [Acanthoscelides obtectus]CAK1665953.1 hypothetical protein AOBTE_LOCUS25070 [Acanthoscelides obtectus]